VDGAIVVDKPEGWTSHDVVNKSRRILGTKKIGHLGTLDPIATGVLPLVIGRATRLARFYTHSDKIYDAVIRFGFSTDTYDRAGKPTSPETEPAFDADTLESHMAGFRGDLMQVPPPVSAKKVDGVRAYKLARQNVAFELRAAPVHVYELALLEVTGSLARVRAHCSAGTYLRSIAHELGQALGCGAHLQQLRRTASGEFNVEQARTIAELELLAAEGKLEGALIPAGRLLPAFPAVLVDTGMVTQIRHGRNFQASPFRTREGTRYVKAVTREGELVAIGEACLPNIYHPVVVF
jgi:tRNA pseudouridine55 synthase